MSTSSILSEVQKNPEITTNYVSYVTRLIEDAKLFVKEFCGLPRYPELSQGYSKSRVNPSTNLSALSTNEFYFAANGSSSKVLTITLANCTTGALTAAELQTVIRAETDATWDEITVVFDDTSGAEFYTFTSGRYGVTSSVNLSFVEDEKHVIQAMQMTPLYGGTEEIGGEDDLELDSAVILLVTAYYARTGFEHAKSGTIPSGPEFELDDLPQRARGILYNRRRI